VLAAAHRRPAEALKHLEHALEFLESWESPWRFEIARTLLALGSVQRAARQKAAARETLERALQIFEDLGARLWSEKARAELSQIGGRPQRSGSLTITEQRIAELVARGRSNAEVAHELFLSPKTVEWNLSKIVDRSARAGPCPRRRANRRRVRCCGRDRERLAA
jgi:DNA-binding CsgD family transcriptional regulator